MDQSKLADACGLTLVLYTTLLLMCGLGCIGNILAFLGFQKEKKKTPTTFLLQCLAVADTAFLVCFASCLCTDALLQCADESYSPYYRCHKQARLFYFCDPPMYLAHLTSVWITVFVGVIRFAAVCYPLNFKNTFTSARVKRICLIALVLFALFEAFWLVVRDVAETDTITNQTCVARVNRNEAVTQVYIMGFTFVIHYLIPLTTLTFITVKIIIAVRGHNSERSEQNASQLQSRSITRILVAILTIFLTCNTFHLVQMALFLAHVYGDKAGYAVFFISRSLLVINSGINVIVYVTVNKRYRKLMLTQLYIRTGNSGGENSTSVSRATSAVQLHDILK